MTFEQWWIEYRGFDDPIGKDGARLAFEAGVMVERERCLRIAAYYDVIADAIRDGRMDIED